MILDPVVIQLAALTGFMAAAIAVGGFLAHAREAIAGQSEGRLRSLTAVGGLFGLGLAVLTAIAGALL